jgi:putative endopeptidase
MAASRLRAALFLAAACLAGPALAHPHHDDGQPPENDEITMIAPSAAVAAQSLEAVRFGAWGVDLAAKDKAVKPGDDFFRHVGGTWMRDYQLPADRSMFGAFNALDELSQARVRDIIQSAARDPSASADLKKVGDMYAAFMDERAVNRAGIAPLRPVLERIRAVQTRDQIVAEFGRTRLDGGAAPFSSWIGQDRKAPDRYAINLVQSGLALPDRDFYLEDGERFKAARAAYVAMLERLFALAGEPDGKAKAQAVLALETEIARAHWTRAESRDRDKTYNRMTLAQLQEYAPGVNWRVLMAAWGVQVPADGVVVSQNTAYQRLARLVADTPVETWRTYLLAGKLRSAAPMLSQPFQDAHFQLYGKTLRGLEKPQERWRRAVDQVNGALGDAVGQVYVARYFPPESKAAIDSLVSNVSAAMGRRLDALTWMSADTKARAHEKLAGFGLKIGYPTVWDSYDDLEIRRGDPLGNAMRAGWAEWRKDVARLGQPVDRREWFMTPQTVNAYYSPQMNEIVFPAAILQPPFFDPKADPAVNYGAIGGVIGHEISHGFDDQGRKSDAAGVERDWWTAEDGQRFVAISDKLVAQYNAFCPLPGQCVNGRVALGENIADLAGLTVALDAYRASLNGKPSPVIDGLTGEQRVFLGWAQVWRSVMRDAELSRRLATGPHSPPEFRVNGVVRNMDAWYEAFGVQPGDKLYVAPEDRVRLW